MDKKIIEGGRAEGKMFQTFMSFISEIESGKSAIILGPKYVVMSRKYYAALIGNPDQLSTIERAAETSRRLCKYCGKRHHIGASYACGPEEYHHLRPEDRPDWEE